MTASRLTYWPCLGIWPPIALLLGALPFAVWARRDTNEPCSIMCTTAYRRVPPPTGVHIGPDTSGQVDASCSVNDPELRVSTLPLPCGQVSAALTGVLDARNPLHRARLRANVMAPLDPAPEDAPTDKLSEIDAAGARALLIRCAESPPATSLRTVVVSVRSQDYGPSVIVLLVAVVLAILAALRRRVVLEIDRVARLLVIVERGFVRERRTAVVPIEAIKDVQVTAGAVGFLSGRRVEVVCGEGATVSLTESFLPLTFDVHAQASRRLLAMVRALEARTP